MDNPLRILMLEDRPEDAALTKEALRKGGLRFSFACVDTKDEFVRQLDEQKPDVILSDHGLPAFDGFSALRLVKQKHPDLPVVFVTGALGEEFAIRTFEMGASDYVLKHRLSELAPAVKRALSTAEESRRRRAQDDELRRNGELFLNLLNGVKDYAFYMLDPQGRVTTWNKESERLEGHAANEVLGRPFDVLFPPEDVARGKPRQLLEAAAQKGRHEEEGWCLRRDGTRVWMNMALTAVRNCQGTLQGFVKVARD
ncbi:MAG TPA: response regulator, partial [Candidatus Limnocylindria bacterium]|nr:response regulator [Candidatus Limnocylindria bacterium]